MWNDNKKPFSQEFSTPPPYPRSKKPWNSAPSTPIQNLEKKKPPQTPPRTDSFHVIHKVPNGDSPYVKAKHVQLIDKDPSKAISLFWSAINAGDRVDSALKDMAIVMKQLDRTDEAIEAVKSFRHLCTPQAQESLDNVLIDLYKRGGRIEEHIELLEHKLKLIDEGAAFGGKRTKLARSQGKKFHVSVEQEKSRILGNLAWAYMQQCNYTTAEELYRKALSIEPDKNKQCNLAICLMNMGQFIEAKSLLQAVTPSLTEREMSDPFIKSFDRAYEMLTELKSESVPTRCEEVEADLPSFLTSPVSSNLRPMTPITEEKSRGNSAQKWMRGSYSNQKIEERFDSSYFEKGRWNSDREFKEKGDFQTSRCSPCADKWKKQTCSRRLFERGSGLSGFKNVELASDPRTEECGANKNINTYGSPFSFNRGSRLKYREPECGVKSTSSGGWRTSSARERKCSLQSSPGGNWRRPWDCDAEDKQGGIWRRPWDCDSYREQNFAAQSSANVDWRRPNSGLQPSANVDWRKGSLDYHAHEKQAMHSPSRTQSFDLQSSANRDTSRRSLNYDADNRQVISSPTIAPSVACSGTVCGQHLDERSEVTISDSMNEHIGGKDSQDKKEANGSTTGESSVKHQGFSFFKSGKSWADMVEEEEEELLRECTNASISTYNYCKSADKWNEEEFFNDENMDSNILCSTPRQPTSTFCPPSCLITQPRRDDYTKDIRQKLENVNLNEGHLKSSDSYSSKNSTARRALAFEKSDSADLFHPSPLRKVLFFNSEEEDNSAATMAYGGKHSSQVRNQNKRLQVFQEITL